MVVIRIEGACRWSDRVAGRLHLGHHRTLGQGSQSGILTTGKSEPIAGLYRPTRASPPHRPAQLAPWQVAVTGHRAVRSRTDQPAFAFRAAAKSYDLLSKAIADST
jgi:hypothetical protein